MGSFIILTKLIFFSPNDLPEIITEEISYSLMEHSVPLQLCCKKTTEDISKTEEIVIDAPIAVQKSSPLVLFKDIKFYVIWVAHSVFVLRLGKIFIKKVKKVIFSNISIVVGSWLA